MSEGTYSRAYVKSKEAKYEARIDKLEAALREVEWYFGDAGHICLFCWRRKTEGHAKDCLVGQALKPTGDG
jgi:hypothetical protein